ncbi:hypothetical protein OAB56_04295, partial [Gammaproteobacteria bacterium]|nr:hypothetical protein [Gammaproteobacteria bacterium]
MTAKIIVRVPVDAATFLLNEKRQHISEVQHRLDVEILVIPELTMVTPQYSVQRVRLSDVKQVEYQQSSYKIHTDEKSNINNNLISTHNKPRAEQPVVKQFVPSAPVPIANIKNKTNGFITRLFGNLFRMFENKKLTTSNNRQQNNRSRNESNSNHSRDRSRRNNTNNQQRRNSNTNNQQKRNSNTNNQQRYNSSSDSNNAERKKTQQKNNEKNLGDEITNADVTKKNLNSGSRRGRRGSRKRKQDDINNTVSVREDTNMTKSNKSESMNQPDMNVNNMPPQEVTNSVKNAHDDITQQNSKSFEIQHLIVETAKPVEHQLINKQSEIKSPSATETHEDNEVTQINPKAALYVSIQDDGNNVNKTDIDRDLENKDSSS